MEGRDRRNALDAPMAVYEVHLGSWRRNPDGSYYTYRQLADELVSYVVEMGYTHVEFLPPTEHVRRLLGLPATGSRRDEQVRHARRLQAPDRRVPQGGVAC